MDSFYPTLFAHKIEQLQFIIVFPREEKNPLESLAVMLSLSSLIGPDVMFTSVRLPCCTWTCAVKLLLKSSCTT